MVPFARRSKKNFASECALELFPKRAGVHFKMYAEPTLESTNGMFDTRQTRLKAAG
jgi:hypothetical protein